ncbi:MAG: chemotaxis protein CheB, partial [Bacteroidia bacterium]
MQTIQYPDTLSPHYIVAIGASAGGLEAIHEFFDNMPFSGNMSFVIIQHLSPHYKSLLVELVARHTTMQVVEAGHDIEVQKGFVYVIPNDKILLIAEGRLMLSEKHFEKAPNTAIDLFLKSLAVNQGDKGIAVILSGTGTDGTQGAKAIKEAGGIVLVQDPLSAKFDGMPNSAIDSGHADYILLPELMPEEIFAYINEEPVLHAKNGRPTEQNLPEVLGIILNHCGLDFHNYKSPTLLRRMAQRMSSIGKKNFTEYLEFLRSDTKECGFLANEFLINVTRFFRDKAAFAILQTDVLRRLIKEKEEGAVLKVWVTACSTGQEAYSIAIAINEAQLAAGKILDVKIFATDIDKSAVDEAAKGCYPEAAVADLDPQLIQKYFTRQDGFVFVNSKIRKQIVFARQNILKDPPFIKNDLVSCRNMLIYMNPILQRQVFGTLQFGLNVGGYLFLGPSEMPGSIKENLEEINGKWKIYKKFRDAVPNTAERYSANYKISPTNTVKPKSVRDTQKEALHEDFQEILTEEYGFAAVYIDEACEIKEGVGDFRRYLLLPD